jgi:hypothetical protein
LLFWRYGGPAPQRQHVGFGAHVCLRYITVQPRISASARKASATQKSTPHYTADRLQSAYWMQNDLPFGLQDDVQATIAGFSATMATNVNLLLPPVR